MSVAALAIQLLNGLASASSLFLVAAGLTLIFGVTRIVNFAHGSFYMLGAYLAYAIGEALTTLTEEQREAITLRFFAGLSAREAAEAMGKQEGTVRGLQFRAIASLRRQLGIDDGREPLDLRTTRRAGASTDG